MTHKKLENETKATIDVPKKGKNGNIGKNVYYILVCHTTEYLIRSKSFYISITTIFKYYMFIYSYYCIRP